MDIAGNSFSLFVLYLVISGNFLAPLFSCRLREMIENSMFARHILGFLTLTFFVVIATKSSPMSYQSVMIYSAIFYIWFLLTTRMRLHFWFVFIALIGTVYLIHLYQSDLTSDEPSPEAQEQFDAIKKVLTALAGVITILGVVSYYGEKRIEYGSKFKFEKFILGRQSCKGDTPPITLLETFRGAFKG